MTTKLCSVEDCDKTHKGRGYCEMHLKRLKNTGSLDLHTERKICAVSDCDLVVKAKTYCRLHYRRYVSTGSTNKPERKAISAKVRDSCSVVDCDGFSMKRGMCERHYRRYLKYGDAEAPLLKQKREVGYKELTANGYIRSYGHKDHPNSDNGRVREHVLVMENILGRFLYKGENVHHKNGQRNDNRPENLELWITSQPYGQRPEDLVTWAEQILERYKIPSLPQT